MNRARLLVALARRHPVLAAVVSVILSLLGVAGLVRVSETAPKDCGCGKPTKGDYPLVMDPFRKGDPK